MAHSFQEVMKQWKRWCESHGGRIFDDEMKATAKIDNPFLYAMENAKDVESSVMSWAENNPEPVYPTWAEWLTTQGVLEKAREIFVEPYGSESFICYKAHFDGENMDKPIPPDVAQKLGVKPLNV